MGLGGFGATMLISSFVESLTAVYAERFLSGMFAGAVTPVAAAITDFATTEQRRARRLAFVSIAGGAGFLLGPMLGVLISRLAAGLFTIKKAVGSIAMPLGATALLAFLVGSLLRLPCQAGRALVAQEEGFECPGRRDLMGRAEAARSHLHRLGRRRGLRGRARAARQAGTRPDPYQIGLMFSECSLVMIVVQAIVFSPLGQAGYDSMAHRADAGRPGGRFIPRASGVRTSR